MSHRPPPVSQDPLPPRYRLLILLISVFAFVVVARLTSHPMALKSLKPLPLHTRISINRASASVLELLPHVGPVVAHHIIATRKSRGPFHDEADLEKVHGIGPRTAKQMLPFIRFDTASR